MSATLAQLVERQVFLYAQRQRLESVRYVKEQTDLDNEDRTPVSETLAPKSGVRHRKPLLEP